MRDSFPVVKAITVRATLSMVVCMPIVALLKVKLTRFAQRFLPSAKAQNAIPILPHVRVRTASLLLLRPVRVPIASLLLLDVLVDIVSRLPDAPARIVYPNPRSAQVTLATLLLPQ
jgi:hypothetical protein